MSVDWTSSMQQTFEYYIVDPNSWEDKEFLNTVISSSIKRDSKMETLGSASIEIKGEIEECYIRIYLVTVQNGSRTRTCLGTFMVQTPSISYDGTVRKVTLDGYTPLIELKEKLVPIGYSLDKGVNPMDMAYRLCLENMRAPVFAADSGDTLEYNFVSESNETWLSYISSLLAYADYEFSFDDRGQIIFNKRQDVYNLQPVWTFSDDNSSILLPELSLERDLYGIPNVVEVSYTSAKRHFFARSVNNSKDSPVSVINRGREIVHRVTNPTDIGEPTQDTINEYADRLLKAASALEYQVSYTHGYCPVTIGDCVLLNYERAGLKNVKAKVVSQVIKCEPGVEVEETATFSLNLMEDTDDINLIE